jgi:hypothetical protein
LNPRSVLLSVGTTYVTEVSATQLDLFLDSEAVVLANELAAALLAHDAARAIVRLREARPEELEHPELPALSTLTQVLSDWRVPERDTQAIAKAVARLDGEVVPAAQSALGLQAPRFLGHFFAQLAELADGLAYDPAHHSAHRASLCLRAGDFDSAERAALAIPHWRETPDALLWLTIARYHLRGLEAARDTLFAFAWRAPDRIEHVLTELADELLERDWRAFEAASDWESLPASELPAWFPAWYVMEHPAVAGTVDSTLSPEAPAAEATRLLARLLDLEKEGNSRALAVSRARLRTLNAELFALYMARRTVRYS